MSHSPLGRMVRIALLCMASAALAQETPSSPEEGFKTPPNSAKPRVWWHDERQDHEGRNQLDLEWMNRVGIGGFQNFDASLTTPPPAACATRSRRQNSTSPTPNS
jgi:hypothetical protein